MACEYCIHISDEVTDQLNEIFNYIHNVIKMPQASHGVYDRIKQTILSLREMPLRGSLISREPWLTRGVRFLVAGNYDVYYIVNEVTHEVFVIAVAYSRRHLDNVIDGGSITSDGKFYGHIDGVCEPKTKYNGKRK